MTVDDLRDVRRLEKTHEFFECLEALEHAVDENKNRCCVKCAGKCTCSHCEDVFDKLMTKLFAVLESAAEEIAYCDDELICVECDD